MQSGSDESPLEADGTLKPQAWINIMVALLLKHHGVIRVSYAELMRTNGRQIEYNSTEHGLELSLVNPQEGTA
ncbi:MAG: hypothetical protein OEY86_07480 [Nitrospira sp.]|nr:hypothetical protein [Nitrospira sp.]